LLKTVNLKILLYVKSCIHTGMQILSNVGKMSGFKNFIYRQTVW